MTGQMASVAEACRGIVGGQAKCVGGIAEVWVRISCCEVRSVNRGDWKTDGGNQRYEEDLPFFRLDPRDRKVQTEHRRTRLQIFSPRLCMHLRAIAREMIARLILVTSVTSFHSRL